MTIVIASSNQHKISQIKQYFNDTEIKFLSLKDFPNINEITEDGLSFEENSIKKAVAIFSQTGLPVIADDSGLEVKALNGKPGIYSARYSGENASDKSNNQKLLNEMKNLSDRSARYVCVLTYRDKNILKTFEGTCEGIINEEGKGKKGFGYDPLFLSNVIDKTFGELDTETKLKISHRGKALKQLKEYLFSLPLSSH